MPDEIFFSWYFCLYWFADIIERDRKQGEQERTMNATIQRVQPVEFHGMHLNSAIRVLNFEKVTCSSMKK